MSDQAHSVALLVTPEATASTLFGISDLLMSVKRDWLFLQSGKPGDCLFSPALTARRAGPMTIANGVEVHVKAEMNQGALPDIICIPDLFVAPEESLAGRFDAEIQWLKTCYHAGSTIAAACSGALLLAEAGLLEGMDATTHWGFCDVLARRYPGIRVHPHRALVVTGEGHRLIMAGGGTSWQDLALFLVARTVGLRYAQEVARLYLIDWHSNGQQPFATLARARQTEDPVIGNCQLWLADNYQIHSPVSAMINLSGLSERSFKRRFQKCTGLSPIQYVHALRLEEAKQLLESTDNSIESIAEQVGYEDSSFFSRLFRREVGLTPSQYRLRFGALRRAVRDTRTDREGELTL